MAAQVALVTGASSGIGEAAARRLRDAGFTVYAAARRVDRMAGLREAGVHTMSLDVTDAASAQAAVAQILAEQGRIDVLVNNAGYGFAATVLDTAEEDWDALMDVNVKGVFLCCKHALPHMIAQGGGAIINTASAVSVVGIAERAAYVASKGAVAALTRALAIDHVGQGIRVNCVGVGTVDSPYYEEMKAHSPDPEGLMAGLRNRQLLGRLGTGEEIAAAMVFLASDAASFCVGSTMMVDGGWTAR